MIVPRLVGNMKKENRSGAFIELLICPSWSVPTRSWIPDRGLRRVRNDE